MLERGERIERDFSEGWEYLGDYMSLVNWSLLREWFLWYEGGNGKDIYILNIFWNLLEKNFFLINNRNWNKILEIMDWRN